MLRAKHYRQSTHRAHHLSYNRGSIMKQYQPNYNLHIGQRVRYWDQRSKTFHHATITGRVSINIYTIETSNGQTMNKFAENLSPYVDDVTFIQGV